MYSSILDLKETQVAVKECKDYFERELAKALNLIRVTAPLLVRTSSGLNDELNGIERPVEFDILETGEYVQIVQSLAKWKRYALGRYKFDENEGLYTDMNAIRRDEIVDEIHSIYVDQWDWERVIAKQDRNLDTLKATVDSIYEVILNTQKHIIKKFPALKENYLPENIFYITSQELEDRYPDLSPKQREYNITKEKGAVCIMQIGGKLNSGKPHDGRAPDYDDWAMNCDILLYYELLDIALEISSMGIRVDENSLVAQVKEAKCEHRLEFPFHKAVLNKELPYTIGGGIGQSRLCMFFLHKLHIGEVQVSVWPEEHERIFREKGCFLL